MRIHTDRNLAKIVLAIYSLFNVCFIFTRGAQAGPCDLQEIEVYGRSIKLFVYPLKPDSDKKLQNFRWLFSNLCTALRTGILPC